MFCAPFRRGFGAQKENLQESWYPSVDIHEDKNNLIIKAELPGIKKEDVSIEIKDNVLTIKGERKRDEEIKRENYHRIERVYGSFSRSFTLPDAVKEDKVKAGYKDGILEITLPKAEKAQTKAIPITVE
ncbi:MAG: Hsp20/alpha crystallin family protein [Proteobacteria bacterium]|nr:Hsp20/alpha crystallin family protein [Pseudomonadota bacterium]